MDFYPQGKLISAGKTLFCILILGAILGCGGKYKVLDENKDAPLSFDAIEVKPMRKGAEVGLRIRAVLEGYGPGSPNCTVMVSILDGQGEKIISAAYTPSMASFADSIDSNSMGKGFPALLRSEISLFSWPEKSADPVVDVFLPYHYLDFSAGNYKLQIALEALEGRLNPDKQNDRPWLIQGAKNLPRSGYLRFEYDLEMPKINSQRLLVQELLLDSSQFDPHGFDFVLVPLHDAYGFPDVFWSLGIEYEELYQSPFFKNSLSGKWTKPTPVFFSCAGREQVRICIYDWDDAQILNNADDPISCWEGDLNDLSRNPGEPTSLSFPMVKMMKVVVLK